VGSSLGLWAPPLACGLLPRSDSVANSPRLSACEFSAWCVGLCVVCCMLGALSNPAHCGIFTLAIVNIDNENIQEGLGITRIILCVFGLLYVVGFWRIQMRKRFGLPGNGWCCGQPKVTDLV
jgi:Cys-rich protein (TIGR01571 family)